MLNIGTAYFNTPQDKLTKEMIMDYKQAEEERYAENDKGLVFEPTGLAEPIKAYVPKEYGTSGAEADETLLKACRRPSPLVRSLRSRTRDTASEEGRKWRVDRGAREAIDPEPKAPLGVAPEAGGDPGMRAFRRSSALVMCKTTAGRAAPRCR